MAKRKTKAEKFIEAKIDSAFAQYGSNVQFNMFDLSKITNEVRAAAERDIASGLAVGKETDAITLSNTIDKAMQEAIAKYRQN